MNKKIQALRVKVGRRSIAMPLPPKLTASEKKMAFRDYWRTIERVVRRTGAGLITCKIAVDPYKNVQEPVAIRSISLDTQTRPYGRTKRMATDLVVKVNVDGRDFEVIRWPTDHTGMIGDMVTAGGIRARIQYDLGRKKDPYP